MHENLSRSRDLDVAKGLGILLVVVGHGYSHSTNIEVLIYGFHMPFFFIVSGMIYGQKQEQFRFDFCKKIRTLIIPYLFFEFMWWLCIALMNVKNTDWDGTEIAIKAVFFRGNIATWYLPCLFLTELIFWMVLHTGKFKYFVIAVLYVLGVALPGQLNESWLTILRPLVGVGFFALGYYGYKVFQIKCNGFINLGLTILYILIAIHNGLILFYVREFHNIFLFVISSVIGTYLVLRFSANITEMANRYNCCNILFSRLCYWGENSLAIMCIHMFVIEILRALDYRLFNSFLPVLGESEGIFLGCVIMLCCEMIIPVLNKYFSFCIGKKKSFYGGGHQD